MSLYLIFKSLNLFWYDSIHSCEKQTNDVLNNMVRHRKRKHLLFGRTRIALKTFPCVPNKLCGNRGTILPISLRKKKHLRLIRRIRKCMSQSNLKRIVNALVISQIDFSDPTVEHEKLQRVQNIAARLITGSSRRDHITPVLKNWH